jgi:allophanate hydrolase
MIPDLSIAFLLQSYRNRSLTPREVVQAAWARAGQGDARIWISRPTWEQVEAMLTGLENQGPARLPLYGIPFAIKDNIDWAGHPTTAACPAFSYTPEKSATVVEKLISAGAIPLGKTNLDQFATGLVGMRSPYGTPANAFNAEYIPGGSSSGSAVAVALGQVSFSLGTDTAGSGRVPASFNNLVGLKPTKGLLSTSGVVPACRTLDCVSIFALTCADAAAVLEVTAGYDAADPYSRPDPRTPKPHDPASVVIGVPKAEQLQFFGNDSAKALFGRSVKQAEAIGWRVREIDFQPFLDAARLLYEGPWVAERYAPLEDFIKSKPEALHPVTLEIIGGGAGPSAVAAFKSQYKLAELRRASEAVWSQVDVILTPTAGTLYKVAEVEASPIKLNSNLGYYTNFMNLLDLAAWAVPAGFLDNAMPWGVTFIAPAFGDSLLATLASRFHHQVNLPVGKLVRMSREFPAPDSPTASPAKRWIKIAVCGAHMEGLPLHHQLTSRGARFVSATTTAPEYRFFFVPGAGSVPDRPGLVRVWEDGASIAVEVWEIPEDTVGSFVDGVAGPLGFSRVKLADGTSVCGFICEAAGVRPENEITRHGGWRAWLSERTR